MRPKGDKMVKNMPMYTKCVRCEEPILHIESDMNQGLCDKCFQRQRWLTAIYGERFEKELEIKR